MNKLLYMTLIVLLLILMSACGGGSEAASEQELAATTAEDGETDEAGTAAVEMDAGEDEAEGAEMDEASAIDENSQPAADSTNDEVKDNHEENSANSDAAGDGQDEESAGEEASEVDRTESEADGEEMAEEADDSAMAASGDGWGESGSGAQSACDHPYMPMREGATWTYDTGDGSYTWEVTSVEGDMNEAAAKVLVTVDEITLEYHWECASGKGISSFDFAGLGMTSALPEMTMEITSAEGEFLPPAEEMVPGHTWTAEFEQTINFMVGEEGAQIEATGETSTVQNSRILSANPITAAGVTVDGVQVEQLSEITMVMDVMGAAVEQAQELNNVFELGRGIGIMRQSVEAEFGPSAVELTSFFIP